MTMQNNPTAKLTAGSSAPHALEAKSAAVSPTVRAKCGSCGVAVSTYPATDFPAPKPAHGITPEDAADLDPGEAAPHGIEVPTPRGPQCRACGVCGRVRLAPTS